VQRVLSQLCGGSQAATARHTRTCTAGAGALGTHTGVGCQAECTVQARRWKQGQLQQQRPRQRQQQQQGASLVLARPYFSAEEATGDCQHRHCQLQRRTKSEMVLVDSTTGSLAPRSQYLSHRFVLPA
jgi:hypothetical protein